MNSDNFKWLELPEAGTTKADLPFLALEDTFVSGDTSNHRLSVCYFKQENDNSLLAKALFGPGTQGPPEHAHGGSMAALLDEAMGGSAWMAGYPVVAAQLNITFRAMLPLGTRCLVKARVVEAKGRKIKTTAELLCAETGLLFCKGEALFVVLDEANIEKLSAHAKAIIKRMHDLGHSSDLT
ncbi:MAG: PaaI family thioesterase [bacterium]|nr:PaaI family thioesterase [bacterium]